MRSLQVRWHGWPVFWALLVGACGGNVKYTQIVTHAQSIEQPPPGQALLHAAPVDKSHPLLVAFGGSASLGSTPGRGDDGAALYQDHMGAASMAFAVDDNVELGVVGRMALVRPGNAAGGAPPTPGGARPFQWGVRLRGSPGTARFRLGLSVETGLRAVNLAHGVSVSCDVAPGANDWVRTGPDSQCSASRPLQGKSFADHDFYLNAMAYPSFRLGESIWLFAGAGFDSLTVGHTEKTVVAEYQYGGRYLLDQDESYKDEAVGIAVAGMDARLGENVGLLLNFQMPFGDRCLPGPQVEGAISFQF